MSKSTTSAGSAARYERVVSRMLFSEAGEHFTLVVTSAASGEGGTTTCVGVARALAASTRKSVLLIDANLRRPALHALFGIDQQPGLADLTSDAVATAVPNLFVVPSGSAVENPAQLITSGPAHTALRLISAQFDYVIIDCPPLLEAVEAGSICRLGTGVVLVLRAGITPREDAIEARDRLEGMPVMGVILTGV